MFSKLYWKNTTRNRKTGDIPTAYVGATREESKESCRGCPLLETSCYAQKGVVAVAHNSLLKRVKRIGERQYTLKHALFNRNVRAKYVRLSAIGEPTRCDPSEVREHHDVVRKEGLGWLAYTHFYEEAAEKGIGDLFTASTHSLEEADRMLALGAKRATVVVNWDYYDQGYSQLTPGGAKAIVCPAMAAHSKGSRVTCNECGLCDPAKPGPKVIMFPEHGTTVQSKLKQAAKAGKIWATNLIVPL
jgi:hypothetical protein